MGKLKKFTLYTNSLSDRDKERIQELLKEGYAVCVDTNCIGHSKAMVVRNQGELYLKSLGATLVDKEFIHVNSFYALKPED